MCFFLRILLRRFLISEPIARETLPASDLVPNARCQAVGIELPEEAIGPTRSTAPIPLVESSRHLYGEMRTSRGGAMPDEMARRRRRIVLASAFGLAVAGAVGGAILLVRRANDRSVPALPVFARTSIAVVPRLKRRESDRSRLW